MDHVAAFNLGRSLRLRKDAANGMQPLTLTPPKKPTPEEEIRRFEEQLNQQVTPQAQPSAANYVQNIVSGRQAVQPKPVTSVATQPKPQSMGTLAQPQYDPDVTAAADLSSDVDKILAKAPAQPQAQAGGARALAAEGQAITPESTAQASPTTTRGKEVPEPAMPHVAPEQYGAEVAKIRGDKGLPAVAPKPATPAPAPAPATPSTAVSKPKPSGVSSQWQTIDDQIDNLINQELPPEAWDVIMQQVYRSPYGRQIASRIQRKRMEASTPESAQGFIKAISALGGGMGGLGGMGGGASPAMWNPMYQAYNPYAMGAMAGGMGGKQPFVPQDIYNLSPDQQQSRYDRFAQMSGFKDWADIMAYRRAKEETAALQQGELARRNLIRNMIAAGGWR